ncbi:MAG TPA: cyclic nucleotide-binding domain-containing protein [Oculatellaceae cyanobacterium]|jgi:small-conductance mechanosensitive channel
MSIQANSIFAPLIKLLTAPIFEIGSISISLSAIATFILLMIAVVFVARLLSTWLKHRLLVRLGLEHGDREAIATIIAYFTGSIGFLIVLQTAGINLNSLTVLAGGLGIGLGFGLQTLANNFISGMTLLLERTIKVGDFIEVDGLAGTIKQISMRSTIIKTIDGISVIVPNLDFIENKIINWSHQDPDSRLRIPVGVAYGSDPVLVTETLLSSAYLESRVLYNPPPEVWLTGFGDNALNFELLVWINKPAEREPIKSSLNFIIEHELRQRRIEIPFPQQDVWIRNREQLQQLISSNTFRQQPEIVEFDSVDQSPEENQKNKSINQPINLRELLRKVTYFEDFNDLELLRFIEQGYRKIVAAETVLFRENDPGNSFYIILAGSVEVFSEKANKYLTTLHAGDFFGELSLLMGIPRSASTKTLEETILFVVSHNGFKKLLTQHKGLADQIIYKLAERQQELAERQQSLRDLGLVDAADLDKNPLVWVRKRLNTFFGL